jgi:probable F420-dependent oxidoreductase
MRFTYAESMCEPKQMIPLAQAAEEAGYDGFSVPDSICYPRASDTHYPYTGDGNREFLEGKPFIETFMLMGMLGAVTTKINFNTFVVKLPIRHPVLVAKQLTSLAYMLEGRIHLGVGLSPWPEDFAVTGTEWKTRGKRLDEMIEIIRGLQGGEYFGYQGKHYEIPALKLCPVPSQPVPILIGGHAEPALRRAARVGDGWMHGGGPKEKLDDLLDKLQRYRVEYGTDKKDFQIHVIDMGAFTLDGVKRLEDRGVTDCVVGFRDAYQPDTTTLEQKLGALRGFADQVLSKR